MTIATRILLVVFGLLATSIAFVASRGEHSPLHHFIASWGMTYGVMTVLFGILDAGVIASIAAVVGVVTCFVIVFLTDRRDGLTPAQYTLRMLKTGWRQK